jgi:hypothetical protein
VLAFWFGTLSVLNAVASQRHPAFDANLWWIDFRYLPAAVRSLLLVVAGVLLVGYAVRPSTQGWRRSATIVAVAVLVMGALVNTVTFYRAWAGGRITPGVPIPLSLVMVAMLVLVGVTMLNPAASPTRTRRAVVIAITSALFVLGMPLMQEMFFGTTDRGVRCAGGSRRRGVQNACGQSLHRRSALPRGPRAHDHHVRRGRAEWL